VRKLIIGALIAVLSLASGMARAGSGSLDVFTEVEKRIIREYCAAHEGPSANCGNAAHESRGKGKNKRKTLPPGIAKNLQRGKPLPPGIAKQVLPADLQQRLPKRDGYERLIVDGRVILIEAATRIVRDVLEDVLLPD
jgi:hypothetical protein